MLFFWALGANGNGEGEERDGWAIIATILSATYVWSGLHKFNAAFAQETFPWLLHPLGFEGLSPLWFLAPILETSAGILLFLPRTRTWGLGLVVAIHGFLLVALGPLGQDSNSVVWPWNLWMPVLAFLAFFRNSAPIFPAALRPLRGQAIVVAVALLPAMNLFGRWDDYLSFSLYSGRSESGYLLLNENGVRRLPKSFQPYARSATGREGLDIFRWSMETMNVPPYPQARVYESIGRRLLQAGVPPDDLTLVITEKPGFTDTRTRQRIVPLLP
ncbi:hypothetical protein EON79_10310 [bacterium]|nr:MAG: hypothetical protein EON79_10310 [bacterium]